MASKVLVAGREVVRDSIADLFDNVLKLARASGALKAMDAILDYDLHHEDPMLLTDYRFNTNFCAQFGGSEGIYIDAWLSGDFSESRDKHRISIGTLKTLGEDLASMRIMGEACGILTYYASEYVNREIERYTPTAELIELWKYREQRRKAQEQKGE